ncbi:NUDIX hydrolase [Microbispora amethystogenes]|uniref:NUDIX hydrolase n=1 Tax=Microbispora amethystogenes TaxID=1427754 RepID=UPI0033D1A2DF
MTHDEFSAHLGVGRRTVATWHARPDTVLKPDMQRALDTALELAPPGARARFTQAISPPPVASAVHGQALTIAIAIVTKPGSVLLVCRRETEPGLMWAFPAGVVKPGAAPDVAAVRETLAETGVHCAVRTHLGSRVHPVTGVHCDYYLCDYLAGEAQNRDPEENVSVIWAPRAALTRFVPAGQIFPPVLQAIEEDHERPA